MVAKPDNKWNHCWPWQRSNPLQLNQREKWTGRMLASLKLGPSYKIQWCTEAQKQLEASIFTDSEHCFLFFSVHVCSIQSWGQHSLYKEKIFLMLFPTWASLNTIWNYEVVSNSSFKEWSFGSHFWVFPCLFSLMASDSCFCICVFTSKT